MSKKIQQIHQDSRRTYDSPRIQAALASQGFSISRQRIVRLMAKLGINAQMRRKFKATTDSKHSLPMAENIFARNFTANEPDQAWVTDITYV
ncbi:IS3 family transposase [Synechocystis salina LEGE 06099]|uniref:IS3 family transposase n=1 Tax=Synechocystis salina TaxID=945780 RepID=UPI00187E8AEC|nr:IS3 family transposase [Synechocystis salina]MBE9204017.1 IS3 family transposase [Synechocystis salina LEGE 06099]